MAIELFNDGKHVCLMFNDLVDDSANFRRAGQPVPHRFGRRGGDHRSRPAT
jgi:hypothetical protein